MLTQTIIESGAVRGVPTSNPDITVFRGIPFAAPPVGDNRWRAPQPVESWNGVRVCDTYGPPSMQQTPGENPAEFYTREWYTRPDQPMSEDCLYLNVWTPARDANEKLPVMVWIFGGGMCFGYTSEMEFDGEHIASHGVVMVSVNYRLNSFGFLAHRELTEEAAERGEPGTNFGLLDQSAGLRWVKRNIAAFGGDPENVTLFGQSAGGRCTWMHIAAPSDRGLFHKAIVQSGGLGGGISNYPSLAQSEQAGAEFLRYLGVSSIAEARRIPAATLLDRTLTYHGHRWGPTIDGTFLPTSPMKAVASGMAADVRLLLGSTTGDPAGFRMGEDPEKFHRFARTQYGEDYAEFASLSGIDSAEKLREYYDSPSFSPFERGNAFAAGCFAEQGRPPVYLYRFSPDIPGDDAGAFHSSDLWFVFETLAKSWRPFGDKHYTLARRMGRYWTNFAKNGNPNGADENGIPLPSWLAAGQDGWHVQWLGNDIHSIDEEPDALMELELRRLRLEADREKAGGDR